jgi:hypothetical protein
MKTCITVLASIGLLFLSSVSLAKHKVPRAKVARISNNMLIVSKPIHHKFQINKKKVMVNGKLFVIKGSKFNKNCTRVVLVIKSPRTGKLRTLFLNGINTRTGEPTCPSTLVKKVIKTKMKMSQESQ